jgi:phage shock protein E
LNLSAFGTQKWPFFVRFASASTSSPPAQQTHTKDGITNQNLALNLINMSTTDYEKRSAENGGFCTPRQVQQALANPHTIVLDTRTLEEINQDGKVAHVNYKHVSNCTADACPDLSNNTNNHYVPENEKTVPILIYCRSGRRAARAKQILVEKGFVNVLNAGGYSDVVQHLQQQQG